MLPSIFNENVFDDLFDQTMNMDMFGRRNPLYGKHAKEMMKTDVRETEDSYVLDIDLPGFKKDELHVELENGYLTIRPRRAWIRTRPTRRAATSVRSVTPVP